MKIEYIEDNLFTNIPEGKKVYICHITNVNFGWGAGFVIPLAKHFPEAEIAFRSEKNPVLGNTQFVEKNDVIIANMFAQEGYKSASNPTPIRYEALEKCMKTVAEHIFLNSEARIMTIPFGSGLAGGDWTVIEGMIQKIWIENDIPVTICYAPPFSRPVKVCT